MEQNQRKILLQKRDLNENISSSTTTNPINVEKSLFPQSQTLKKSQFSILQFDWKPAFHSQELDSFDPKVLPPLNPTTLAVGVIGRAGVGKTTLITQMLGLAPYISSNDAAASNSEKPKKQSTPPGIDLYQAENLLLLDTFPLFSYPDRMIKKGYSKEIISLINAKVLLFLLCSCHVLLVVMDKPEDRELIEYLARIQSFGEEQGLFSPSTGCEDGQTPDHCHVITVFNKCKPDQFSFPAFENSKKQIQKILASTSLNFAYSLNPTQKLGQALLSDSHYLVSPVNYFALPHHSISLGSPTNSAQEEDKDALIANWSVMSSLNVAFKELLNRLKLIPNYSNKARYCISHRDWYAQASDIWNGIQRIELSRFSNML